MLGCVIVIVTAALRLTVVFVAAHSTSIRIRNNNQMSRSLRGPSQEGIHGKSHTAGHPQDARRPPALDGTQSWAPPRRRNIENAMVKTIALAFR
jgi:hypothetical protein